jgi:hypothetical protein
MTDLAHIEALVGPLPKGREYARLTIGDKTIDWNDKADAALAEAYAVIERQARMLREAAAQVASLTVDDVTWNELHVDEVLADLAARYEEEHHD